MNRSVRVLALLATLIVLFATVGCSKLKARDQLNKGVTAFKNARYEDATEKFKNAIAYDPQLLTARLYLGTAYMQQYIPGSTAPDNMRFASEAIDEFQRVLSEPTAKKENKLHAIKSIASLYYNMKEFDDSIKYYQKAIDLDPNDPETYYMIGVIAWADTYKNAAEPKAKIGLKVDDEYKKGDKEQAKVCEQVKAVNAPKIEEGLQSLSKALDLRPEYEDAMAYENLLYRRKADIECGNPSARTADIKLADEWSEKTLVTRKQKADKAAQQAAGGIVLDAPKEGSK